MPKISKELAKALKEVDLNLFEWGLYGVLYVKGTGVKVADVIRRPGELLGKRLEGRVRRALASILERPLGQGRVGGKRPFVVDWGVVEGVIKDRGPGEVWVSSNWSKKGWLVYKDGVFLKPKGFSLGTVKGKIEGMADGFLFPCGVKGGSPSVVWGDV